MWTGFIDNFTCNKQKMSHPYIVVESSVDDAILYLEKTKRYNPYGPSCFCCGDDYKIFTSDTKHGSLQFSSSFFEELTKNNKILIIPTEVINK